ncbi:hypothetical protein [Actinomadura miaoliensis]|uniref:DUF4352 domain-containing protein n=1 Tax=Actinomadura miaoliensis TaxID=430685 RepID=A0ABP7W2K5_9ACTN
MANNHRPRSHRKKRSAGWLGLAGALTGAAGIAVVAVGIAVLQPDGNGGGSTSLTSEGGPASTPSPRTGRSLTFTTPEGYGYRLAAVRTGLDPRPFGDGESPPSGSTYAYADYVITNTGRRPVLLDYPADLFMPRSGVPASARDRCMPQPGIPDSMCTLPNSSQVTARLDGSKPPVRDGADTLIPAGASYVVRVASDLPVKDDIDPSDLKLYVWNARYTSDRKGVELAFP